VELHHVRGRYLDVCSAFYAVAGVELTEIDGIGRRRRCASSGMRSAVQGCGER